MPERLLPGTPEWRLYGRQHLQRYVFAGGRVAGHRVLDVACGVGYGSYVLAQAGTKGVTGLDLDATAIAYGRGHYSHPRLRLLQADALQWSDPAGKFDSIVSFETIEHLADPGSFVARLAALLAPGGQLILSAPNTLRHQRAVPPIENPFHLSEPDYGTLCSWLAPHFTIEAEWEQSTFQPAAAGEVADVASELRALQAHWWLRGANRLEKALRRLLGSSSGNPPAAAAREEFSVATEVLPLLPDRRETCEVFIFVCRLKAPAA